MLSPMRINYVRINSPDLLYNLKLVVHGLTLPFPHLHHQATMAISGRSGFNTIGTEFGPEGRDQVPLGNVGHTKAAPSPVIESTVEMDYHQGL